MVKIIKEFQASPTLTPAEIEEVKKDVVPFVELLLQHGGGDIVTKQMTIEEAKEMLRNVDH